MTDFDTGDGFSDPVPAPGSGPYFGHQRADARTNARCPAREGAR